jgi:hypothetical protein
MRIVIAATFAAALAVCSPAHAQFTGQRAVPMGYQQLTSLATATGLTVPAGATCVLLEAEAQIIRFRDDGTAPTATIGMQLAVAGPPFAYCGTLTALQFIQASASGILNVLYYRIAG